ncbi:hypothetical protein [Streptomyces noursei]|uniref:hypothetical protein n=1 Tax=Streptomyces noursei TaxID=1971 RepID=UPI0030F2C657
MLFSIPESGWWLIALAATAFFMIGMLVLGAGMKLPEDLRDTVKQPSRKAKRIALLLMPLGCGAILGVNLLRPEPSPTILFLYSVAFASIPIALIPVRGRILKNYIAEKRKNPKAEATPDGLTMAWIISVLSVLLLGAVIALMMTSHHGMRL